jgi:hypothetical protein
MSSRSSLFLSAAGLVVLAGCQSIGEPRAFPAQEMLKGKSRQALEACAGPPVKEVAVEGNIQLLYSKDACCLERSFATAKSSQAASPPHGCRALVRLQDDRVVEVQYHNVPPDVTAQDHCEEIFASCLR